jgi:hypothetical protein
MFDSSRSGRKRGRTAKRAVSPRRALVIGGVAILLEVVAMKLRGYRMGRNVIVRCQQGHLFTTIWIPGGSLKSVRLGLWRLQRCPVGHHWSIVTPVKEAELSEDQKRTAHEHKDIRIP